MSSRLAQIPPNQPGGYLYLPPSRETAISDPAIRHIEGLSTLKPIANSPEKCYNHSPMVHPLLQERS